MATFDVVRHRLEDQGFVGMDDSALAAVSPWARLTPAGCSLAALIGTSLGSPATLWTFAALGILGAIFPRHLFDLVYGYLIRPLVHGPALPRNGGPRRLACGMGAGMMAGAGWAFAAGVPTVGYALGGIMTVLAALAASTHFCVASLIYASLFGKPAACRASQAA